MAKKTEDDSLLEEWTNRLLSEIDEHADLRIEGKVRAKLAQQILQDFCLRAWMDLPQSKYTLLWLAEVFGQILEDGKPDARRAFSLLPRREGGPKQESGTDIALWVELTLRRGYTEKQAKQFAAATFHHDEKHISRLLRKNKVMELNPSVTWEEWEEYFRLMNRPLPEPRRGRSGH